MTKEEQEQLLDLKDRLTREKTKLAISLRQFNGHVEMIYRYHNIEDCLRLVENRLQEPLETSKIEGAKSE